MSSCIVSSNFLVSVVSTKLLNEKQVHELLCNAAIDVIGRKRKGKRETSICSIVPDDNRLVITFVDEKHRTKFDALVSQQKR